MHKPENYGKWFEINEGYSVGAAKMWEENPMYIIVDMNAKAVQGAKAEDALEWAEGELKKIYEA